MPRKINTLEAFVLRYGPVQATAGGGDDAEGGADGPDPFEFDAALDAPEPPPSHAKPRSEAQAEDAADEEDDAAVAAAPHHTGNTAGGAAHRPPANGRSNHRAALSVISSESDESVGSFDSEEEIQDADPRGDRRAVAAAPADSDSDSEDEGFRKRLSNKRKPGTAPARKRKPAATTGKAAPKPRSKPKRRPLPKPQADVIEISDSSGSDSDSGGRYSQQQQQQQQQQARPLPLQHGLAPGERLGTGSVLAQLRAPAPAPAPPSMPSVARYVMDLPYGKRLAAVQCRLCVPVSILVEAVEPDACSDAAAQRFIATGAPLSLWSAVSSGSGAISASAIALPSATTARDIVQRFGPTGVLVIDPTQLRNTILTLANTPHGLRLSESSAGVTPRTLLETGADKQEVRIPARMEVLSAQQTAALDISVLDEADEAAEAAGYPSAQQKGLLLHLFAVDRERRRVVYVRTGQDQLLQAELQKARAALHEREFSMLFASHAASSAAAAAVTKAPKRQAPKQKRARTEEAFGDDYAEAAAAPVANGHTDGLSQQPKPQPKPQAVRQQSIQTLSSDDDESDVRLAPAPGPSPPPASFAKKGPDSRGWYNTKG